MSVGTVDGEQINFGPHQLLGAFEEVPGGANRRSYPQPAMIVLGGGGILQALLNVLDRDQALEIVLIVHHQQLLDAMLVQDRFRIAQGCADRDRDQVFLGHHFTDGNIGAGFEAEIAVGEDADQLLVLGYGHARDAVAAHDFQRIGDLLVGRHGDGIDNHAAFRALDLVHFAGLLLDVEVAMDNAQSALLRHGNGHARFGDGVHGRADERDAKFDVAGQAGRRLHQGRNYVGFGRQQQHVIEGKRLGHRKMNHGFGSVEG